MGWKTAEERTTPQCDRLKQIAIRLNRIKQLELEFYKVRLKNLIAVIEAEKKVQQERGERNALATEATTTTPTARATVNCFKHQYSRLRRGDNT
jgi:hypothetical protein